MTEKSSAAKMVKRNKLGYLSREGNTQIRAFLWVPVKEVSSPKGIIQIVHGVSEHIERYDEFARYLAGQGYVVCGHDHIGHGESVLEDSERGHISLESGKEVLVEDVHELYKLVASRYSRQTPYIMLGHSLGSFIVRLYMARYGSELTAVILSGTAHQPRLESLGGNVLAKILAKTKGSQYRSPFLHKMGTGAFSKTVQDARTEFDWIASDEAVVDAYIADEICGLMLSAGGYVALTDIVKEMTSLSSAEKIPHELPVLLIAGKLDPVGENGKAVERAASFLKRAGLNHVETKLYEGMRHEILNEADRKLVYEDIVAWLKPFVSSKK